MEAKLYYSVYIWVVTFLTIFMATKYSGYSNNRLESHRKETSFSALVLTICMILFIGFRPVSYIFIDMNNYRELYYAMFGHQYYFYSGAENFLFDNVLGYFASLRLDITYFFFFIALIYFGAIYVATKKLFPKDVFYAIIIYLGAFSTFSYGTNGIKAGAAASLFLCAIAYRKQFFACVIFLILSMGFHHSMIMPIVAFVCACLYSRPKYYFYVWVLCLIIAALHITWFQEFFAGFSDDQGAGYLKLVGGHYDSMMRGFRPDFVFYSSAPVMLGYYLIRKCRYRSKFYDFIFCTYTLTNAVWMLCMYASFTNRIAYLSWLMIPIVLIYPFFDYPFLNRQYRKLNIVAFCHLGFTLAVSYIYYGFIKGMLV